MTGLDSRPVCLVTGAAVRLGAAIAEHLATRFDLALHYRSSFDEAEQLAARLRQRGCQVVLLQGELGIYSDASRIVRDAHALFGRLDMVVNNASDFSYDTPSTFKPQEMEALLGVNLIAPLVIARELAGLAGERAVLVNMLDNKVFALNPDFFSYTLGKVALKSATEMLALHFGSRMRVCGIAPGITLISGGQTEENFQKAWKRTPSGRSATPEEIAKTVEFIWDTPSLNGEIIVLDGGQQLLSLERDVAFVVE